MERPDFSRSPGLLYLSPRQTWLRVATVICFLPVPLTAWMFSRVPAGRWGETPLGPVFGWAIPLALAVLAMIMPLTMAHLHGRYVLRLERTPDEGLRLTVFLLWGSRTRLLAPDALAGMMLRAFGGRNLRNHRLSAVIARADFIFDDQGDVPEGWDVIEALAIEPKNDSFVHETPSWPVVPPAAGKRINAKKRMRSPLL